MHMISWSGTSCKCPRYMSPRCRCTAFKQAAIHVMLASCVSEVTARAGTPRSMQTRCIVRPRAAVIGRPCPFWQHSPQPSQYSWMQARQLGSIPPCVSTATQAHSPASCSTSLQAKTWQRPSDLAGLHTAHGAHHQQQQHTIQSVLHAAVAHCTACTAIQMCTLQLRAATCAALLCHSCVDLWQLVGRIVLGNKYLSIKRCNSLPGCGLQPMYGLHSQASKR